MVGGAIKISALYRLLHKLTSYPNGSVEQVERGLYDLDVR